MRTHPQTRTQPICHPANSMCLLQAPTSTSAAVAYYRKIGKEGALRDPYELPTEFSHGLGDSAPALPEAPMIVLINAQSGGRVGPECQRALRHALGYTQVRTLA